MQSTAIIACCGALHLKKPVINATTTNIKVLCTDSTTLLFTRYLRHNITFILRTRNGLIFTHFHGFRLRFIHHFKSVCPISVMHGISGNDLCKLC